jgi:RNA polymerase sigma-70 factor (ECF subfamily)
MAGDNRSEQGRESATGHRTSDAGVDWPVALAQHERWLRTVVLARVGEHAACDDVMQQVALAAMQKGHQLRDPASVGPWLYRLAVVESLQYRRRQGRRRGLLRRFAERVPPTDCDLRETEPLDWLLADERQALVRQALRCLPRRDAEILLLKYTEDWSYRQLAEHLGLSTSAVEARLHRARQRMRRALGRLDATMIKRD